MVVDVWTMRDIVEISLKYIHDNTFVLQQIVEKRKSRNLCTHLVFVDL